MSFLKRFQSSLEPLYGLPAGSKYVIAYSGGIDSHVLLYCCAKLKLPVRAIHIHHGLQDVADEWVNHCRNICEQLDIYLDVVSVDAKQQDGQSPEESARNARYAALHDNLQDGDCLITAQHQNDQAETLLLQLFRTASAAGLSAMPERKQLGGCLHIRPLLSFLRVEIELFAKENRLHWIEDPSNQDAAFDRNYVRKNIIPVLTERWPEIAKQLSTVADIQQSNLRVLEDMAAIDLADVVVIPAFQSLLRRYLVVSVLSITALKKLSTERLFNLLRYWVISEVGVSPTRNLLQEIVKTIINARQEVNPVVVYSGFEYRKYRDELYLLKVEGEIDVEDDVVWEPLSPIVLPGLNTRFSAVKRSGAGLKTELLSKPLRLCFRQGGERFHPENRQHSQSLKKILQEERVPPWERNTFPLLYFEDECIAVVGLWISKQYAVDKNEQGWAIEIEKL